MTIEIKLIRTVSRRADTKVIRGHLLKAIDLVVRRSPAAGVPSVSVEKTETGFSAGVRIPCRSDTAQIRIKELVMAALAEEDNPPWSEANDAPPVVVVDGQPVKEPEKVRPIGTIRPASLSPCRARRGAAKGGKLP